MSTFQEMSDALNEAEYVFFDDCGLLFVWNGSLTVNVYDEFLHAVDCFTLYDHPKNIQEVKDSVQSHIRYMFGEDDES